MGQAASQIAAQIENTRADLGASLQELEQEARAATDWKQHFRHNPMTMVGVAFGGGVMLAAMLGGRKHRRGRDFARAATGAETNRKTSYAPRKAIETLDTIKDALIGVAATKVKDFVGGIVPGFHDEMKRCEEKAKAAFS
jgi:hypothetical protein